MDRAEPGTPILVDEDGYNSGRLPLQIRSMSFMNSHCPGAGPSSAVTGTGS